VSSSNDTSSRTGGRDSLVLRGEGRRVLLRPEGRLEGEASAVLCAALTALAPLGLDLEVDLAAVPALDERAALALCDVRVRHLRAGARERLDAVAAPVPLRLAG
jgi:hypothetical protein